MTIRGNGREGRGYWLAIAAGLVLAPSVAMAQFTETEPNSLRGEANVIASPAGMTAGQTITGNSTGQTQAAGNGAANTIDYYKARIASEAMAGIYRYRYVLTTTNASSFSYTMRGYNQSAGVPTTTSDGLVQTSTNNSNPDFYIQWYGFGKGEDVVIRIGGAAATTSPYVLTLEKTTVTPATTVTTFNSGTITISATSANDTDFWVYDSNFDPVSGFGNDNNTTSSGGTGTGSNAVGRKSLNAGTYYVAIGAANVCNNQASPVTDANRARQVWESANAISASTTTNIDASFTISDGVNTENVSIPTTGPLEVKWVQFTVAGSNPPAAVGAISPTTVTPGTTNALVTVAVTPAPSPGTATVTADLTPLAGSAGTQLFDDGPGGGHGDVTMGDGIFSRSYAVPYIPTPGATTFNYQVQDTSNHIIKDYIAVTVNPVAPPNDTCATATVLSGFPIAYSASVGINQANSDPSGTVSCSASIIQNSVWYTLTPTSDAILELNESGSRDVLWAVYSGGCPGGGGTQLLCNTTDTDVNYYKLDMGTTYYVLVGTPSATPSSGANDVFTLTINASAIPTPPANDDCMNAIDLTGATFPWVQTVFAGGATSDPDISCDTGESLARNGMWYKYTTGAANVGLEVQESDSNTFGNFTVYQDGCGASEFVCSLMGGTSANRVGLKAGHTYYILISRNHQGPATADYDLVINVAPAHAPNGSCESAINISSVPFTGALTNNDDAFAGPGVSCVSNSAVSSRNAIWYTYTPPKKTVVYFRELASQDALIDIYTGTCDGLNEFFCTSSDIAVDATLEGGVTYYFMIARQSTGNAGSTDQLQFVLREASIISPPLPNDLCSSATTIVSVPYHEAVYRAAATNDFKSNCSLGTVFSVTRNGVWYKYHNGNDATVGTVWTSEPNATATKSQVAVFQGNCPTGDLQEVTCGQNSSDIESIRFNMLPDTDYYIMIGSSSTQYTTLADEPTNFSFDVQTLPVPTASNGTCLTAKDITTSSYADFTWSKGAPDETTDINCNEGTMLRNAVWYKFTATQNGFASFSEEGPQDAALAVFASCPATSGSEIRCASTLDVGVVQMTAGSTYYIVCGRWDVDAGSADGEFWDFRFEFLPVVTNDVCMNAKTITQFPLRDTIPFAGLTDETFDITCSGSTRASPQKRGIWYKFTAYDSFVLMAEELGPQRGGTGDQLFVVFDANDCTAFDTWMSPSPAIASVGCSTNPTMLFDMDGGGAPSPVWCIAGHTYYLLVGDPTTSPGAESSFYDLLIYTVGSDVGRCDGVCGLSTRQNCLAGGGVFHAGEGPCPGDFDCSGITDADDLFAFLDAWFAQNGLSGNGFSADIDGTLVVDADDLFAFLDLWFANNGVPCS